jgi:hypothetical protein
VSQRSTSATHFRAKDLLVPRCEIMLGREGGEEREVPFVVRALAQATTNQLKCWPQVRLRQLIDQLVQFLAHRAHA